MAKHLYIIGNGFDIFSGLNTRYSDFRNWLECHYIFVYEALQSAYNFPDIEWWNDFEVSLGKLDIHRFVTDNTPPNKPIETILKDKKDKVENLPTSLINSSTSANRLIGIFDIIHYCMKRWIESMTSITNPKYIDIVTDDSIFLSFNYTKTLELLYEIPQDDILYIHGNAFYNDKLVLGHNTNTGGQGYSYDEEKVADALDMYHKNPYEYIFKHDDFFIKIKDVQYIHIFGLSFSPVDIDYLDWIYNKTSKDAKWDVSWYYKEDKERIYNFVLEHFDLKDKLNLIKLIPVEKTRVV